MLTQPAIVVANASSLFQPNGRSLQAEARNTSRRPTRSWRGAKHVMTWGRLNTLSQDGFGRFSPEKRKTDSWGWGKNSGRRAGQKTYPGAGF